MVFPGGCLGPSLLSPFSFPHSLPQLQLLPASSAFSDPPLQTSQTFLELQIHIFPFACPTAPHTLHFPNSSPMRLLGFLQIQLSPWVPCAWMHPGFPPTSLRISLDVFYAHTHRFLGPVHAFSYTWICPVLSSPTAMSWIRSLMVLLTPNPPPILPTVVRSQKSKCQKVHAKHFRAALLTECGLHECCSKSH